jgi:hypothetical protein
MYSIEKIKEKGKNTLIMCSLMIQIKMLNCIKSYLCNFVKLLNFKHVIFLSSSKVRFFLTGLKMYSIVKKGKSLYVCPI